MIDFETYFLRPRYGLCKPLDTYHDCGSNTFQTSKGFVQKNKDDKIVCLFNIKSIK